MLQYLLNTTCIWLISLALYDLLLARESHHALNRAYLLLTLLLGIFVPLVHWQPGSGIAGSVQPVYTLKEAVVSSKALKATISWQGVLTTVYFMGAVMAAALLATDTWKLVRLYRNGSRHKDGDWTIIETGDSHTPFSFGNRLFVQQRSAFTAADWNMLCKHEQVHTAALHVADVLLLQLARIVFWFHPLVHFYYYRLRMVHEYQADAHARPQAAIYGTFLVEQAMLHAAPSITNSFNRSPIKKRIIMLSKNSSRKSRLKLLLVLPLSVVMVTCFSAGAGARQQTAEDTTVYKIVEVMPSATINITDYLQENLKYPEEAKTKKIEGKVVVKFVVKSTGEVADVTVQRSVHPLLDEEAKRVVSKMPDWKPGKKDGKPVSVYFYMPIVFRAS